MATETMLALGNYRFSIDTASYSNLTRTDAFRWQAQERVGRLPAQQYLGPGDITLRLNGTILPTFRGGLEQINDMRAMANQGKPLLLVDGKGKVHGKWCIRSIEETDTIFFADGTPRKIEFSLDLTRYGED